MLDKLNPELLLPFIKFFVEPGFLLFYCTEVVLIALLLGLLLWRQTFPIVHEVTDARTFLDRAPGERGFHSQFERFHQYVATLPKLSHAWKEFRQSLILPDPALGETVILQTRPASEYFNQETLLSNNINLRFYSWVPNLLTGCGIMGTFIGLSAGVFIAATELQGDREQVQQALTSLLRGASLAFSTSFVGIFTSILFASYERTLFRRLQRRTLDFTEALDERLRLVTPESLSARHLREVEQQTAQLKTFSTDLAVAIGEALDEKVGARLGPALDKLSDTVTALPGLLGDSVSDMTSGELQKVGATLQESRELLESCVGQLADVPREMAQSITSLNQIFSRDLSTVGEQLARDVQNTVEAIIKRFDESGQRFASDLADVSKSHAEAIEAERLQLENATKNFQRIVEESRRLLTDFASAAAKSGALTEAFAESSSALQRAAKSIESTNANISSSAQVFVAAAEAITGQLTVLQESLNVSKTAWSEHERRFQDLDETLKETFLELDRGLHAYTSRAGEFMKELDDHVARISQGLAAAIEPLSETVEELPEEVTRLREAIERLASIRA